MYKRQILTPSVEQIERINRIIEEFVTSNLVISKERIYSPVKQGGLGMVKLTNFLTGLKCTWVRRCCNNINDAWRWEFAERCGFRLDSVRLQCYDRNRNPVIWQIAEAADRFQNAFWRCNKNYLNAPLFENNFFLKAQPRRRMDPPGPVKLNIIRRAVRHEYMDPILNLRLGSCVRDGRPVGHAELCNNSGVPFTLNEFLTLQPAIAFANIKYGGNRNATDKCVKLLESTYARKARSKVFRKFLDHTEPCKLINELQTVRKFFNLVELEVPDPELLSIMYSLWNLHVLPNNIKVFCFQFFNNSLATGPRLAGRYRNNANFVTDERCSCCVRSGIGVPQREDFLHLFWECQAVYNCINDYSRDFGLHGANTAPSKKYLFTGSEEPTPSPDTAVNLLSHLLFFYCIWQCKLQKKMPGYASVKNNFLLLLDNALSLSNKLGQVALTGSSPVCRRWRERHRRG